MKRWLFIGTVLFVGVFLARDLFSATYDLTGTWNYSLSDNWVVSDMGCSAASDTTGTCTISQIGDTFIFAYTSGVVCNPADACTFEGTVSGEFYACSTTDIVDNEGGEVTSTIVFTASSATSASGLGTSNYTHPTVAGTCNWGGNITLTKSGEQPTQYTLTVSTVGSGTVTLNPSGGTYNAGTQVQLTAVPDSFAEFSGWSGDLSGSDNPATITMDSDKNVTATFMTDSDNDGGGNGGGGGGGCFIATAAYGSLMEPHVKLLREVRDCFLHESSVGKAFVNFYYTYSLAVADFIAKHHELRVIMRVSLLPVVGASWVAFKIGPVTTMVLMILLGLSYIGLVWFRRRYKE